MKIVITKPEHRCAMTYIENRRKGIFADYMPTGPEDPFASLLDKASKLEEELEAYDESGNDLLLWFINKYHQQEGRPVIK